MKTKRRFITMCVGLAWCSVAYGRFTPGHVYVSVRDGDPCSKGGPEGIVEIDPVTGASSVFADSSDGICVVGGLRFTPDGQQLLALNFGHYLPPEDPGWVQSFASDGTSTVILDETQGINRPSGANGLVFDEAGDLYILNLSGTLRFPANGAPATVFSDLISPGGLDFAPNGDLFFAGAGVVMRVTPDGELSMFDSTAAASSLAFDRQGNLFVGGGTIGGGATIFRYDNADPGARRILASGFFGVSGVPLPVTVSPDDRVVYFLESGGTLYGIDADDGTTTVVSDFSHLPFGALTSRGIAVYPTPPVPTVSTWGMIAMMLALLTAATLLIIRRRVGACAVGDLVDASDGASPCKVATKMIPWKLPMGVWCA